MGWKAGYKVGGLWWAGCVDMGEDVVAVGLSVGLVSRGILRKYLWSSKI